MSEKEYYQQLSKKYRFINRPRGKGVIKSLNRGDLYHWTEHWHDTPDPEMMPGFNYHGFREGS